MRATILAVFVGSTATLACGGGATPLDGDVGSVSQAATRIFMSSAVSLTTEDATIRDGSFADTNFGSDKTLGVKKASTGFNRRSLLKFDVSQFDGSGNTGYTDIRLELNGALNQADHIDVRAIGGLSTWSESTVTWNKKMQGPLVTLQVYDTATITSTGSHWWAWDIENAVKQLLNAGQHIFVVELQSTTTSSTVVSFKSKEAGSTVAPRIVATRTTIIPDLDSGSTGGCGSDSRIGKACTGKLPSSCVGLTGSVTGKYVCSGSSVVCDVQSGRDYCTTCGGDCGDCAGASCNFDETCGPGSVCNTYPGQLYCAPGCRLKSNLCWAPGTRPSDGDACIL